MEREFQLAIRTWIDESLGRYIEYLEGGGARAEITGSTNNETAKLRASAIGYCPKLHAAQRRDGVRKVFSLKEKYKFEVANRHADLFKEAMKWAMEQERIRQGNVWTVEFEAHMENDFMSGTPDALLGFTSTNHLQPGAWTYLPVEIKRTDAWNGISVGQLWQLVGYMELYKSPVGYLVTMYDAWDDGLTHRVWLLVKYSDGWMLLDSTGEQAQIQSPDFAWDESGVFLGRNEYDSKIESHEAHFEDEKMHPPFEKPTWQCGALVPLETYKRRFKNFAAGSPKPGTGFFTPTCPLSDRCWGSIEQIPVDAQGNVLMPNAQLE